MIWAGIPAGNEVLEDDNAGGLGLVVFSKSLSVMRNGGAVSASGGVVEQRWRDPPAGRTQEKDKDFTNTQVCCLILLSWTGREVEAIAVIIVVTASC